MTPDQVGTINGALTELGETVRSTSPRAGFSDSLRQRLLTEARSLETSAAEAFDRALDGMTVSGDAAALAGFATALRPRIQVAAPQGLRRGLRAELTGASTPVASLSAARARKSVLVRARESARMMAVAAVASSLVATSAVAVAASGSALPGDPLYGVKRFRERVQTWGMSGLPEGLRMLSFAGTRVDEIEGLTERNETRASLFQIPVDDLEIQTMRGTDLILAAQADGVAGAAEALPALTEFLEVQHDRLVGLEEAVPAAAKPLLLQAIATIERAAERTATITTGCVGCSPEQDPTRPGLGGGPPPGCAGVCPAPSIDPGFSKTPPEPSPPPAPRPTTAPRPEPPRIEPVPDPDRIPNLPGRIDDELEDPFRRLIEEFTQPL
ncbi:MAG: hypothetical protein ACLGH3_09400 [Actinomycetota bacterium]